MQLPLNNLRRARPLLGTLVEITAIGMDRSILSAGIDAGFHSIQQVQQLMSFHVVDSDVSRINSSKTGDVINIDSRTYHVLRFAHQVSEQSDGAFDITTAAILVHNGFLPKPHQGFVSAEVSYRDLELLPNNKVRWRQKGWINLGGIAKGYAVDCAIAALREHNILTGVVNAGGDLRCFGEAQPIFVRHPRTPTAMVYMGSLLNGAIATSAGYFAGKEVNGHGIDPLVDPKHQACTTWNESVSIIAADCMTADTLTKVIRLAPASAPDILAIYHAQAMIINEHEKCTCGEMLLQEEIRI